MATKKKVSKKANAKPHSWTLVLLGAVLFVGLGIGLMTAYRAGATRQRHEILVNVATGAQLEAARNTITKQYLAASSTECTDPNDPVSDVGRVAVFYKYLRVNIYADRAVIRGCDNHDTLLAKIDGSWQATQVNLNLDSRANPRWQKACIIGDITRTDVTVRPENSSIDTDNYKLCRALLQGKILTLDQL